MVKKLLSKAEKIYKLKIEKYKTIHDTEKTRVLAIQSNRGKFILKTLYKPIERQLFILEAEEYLRRKKIRIPHTMVTKNKKSFFMWNGHPYILQKWVNGTSYPLKNKARMKKVASILGDFHRTSAGFVSNYGYLNNGSHSWKRTYEDSLEYLNGWKIKHSNTDDKKIVALLSNINFFIDLGQRVYESCMEYPYFKEWTNLPLKKHYLCHGDFHTSNLLVKDNMFYIIDWEDVRYDFPSKDFNRLVSFMMMTRYPEWDQQRFEMMLASYLKKNPLSKQEMGLFFHDMAFPHNFVRHLKNELYRTRSMSLSQVKVFIKAEQDKIKYMMNQLQRYT